MRPRFLAAAVAAVVVPLLAVPTAGAGDTAARTTLPQTVPLPGGYATGNPAIGGEGTIVVPAATAAGSDPRDAVVTLRRPRGDWSGPVRVTPEGVHTWEVRTDVDREGLVWLLWSRPSSDDPDRGLYLQSISKDGTRSPARRLTSAGSLWYDLAVDFRGGVTVVWAQYGATDDETGTFARRLDRYDGWSRRKRLGDHADGDHPLVETGVHVAVMWGEDDGQGGTTYLGRVWDTDADRWRGAVELGTQDPATADGLPSDLTFGQTEVLFTWPDGGRLMDTSDGALSAVEPALALRDHAFVVDLDGTVRRYTAQGQDGNGLVTEAVRSADGTWSGETTLAEDPLASSPDAVIDSRGRVTLTVVTSGLYPDGETYSNGRRVYVPTPSGPPTPGDMVAGYGEPEVDPLATNGSDVVLAGTVAAFEDAEAWVPHVAAIDHVGPRIRVRSLPRWVLDDEALLSWSARDLWTPGESTYDVSVFTLDHVGATSEVTPVGTSPDDQGSMPVPVPPGLTSCFWVGGTDAWGYSRYAQPVCTAAPVDDRDLVASSAWRRRTDEAAYQGTLLTTSRRGATLSLRVSTEQLALVATTCPGCGRVAVHLGERRLKVIDLDHRSTRHQAVLPIDDSFDWPRSGKVRVEVLSSGEPVRIDGLATSTTWPED